MMRIAAFALLLLSAPSIATAQDSFIVSGICRIPGPGKLYVFLVGEGQFATPMSGRRSSVIDLSGPSSGTREIAFSFIVPAGEYGIRCFLDVNGNGELDRGLLGPSEPWGMSWRRKRPARIPIFSDISFRVDMDTACPAIVLK